MAVRKDYLKFEADFAMQLKQLPGIVLVLSHDGAIQFSNDAFDRLPDVSPSVSKETLRRACKQALQSGTPSIFEIGESYQCEVKPILNSSGKITSAAAICQDVTSLRNEALFVDAQGVAHIGTWEWTLGQPNVIWSQELYKIYGVTPETFKPSFEGFLAKVHPDDRDRVRENMTQVFTKRISFSHDERIIRPDGSVRHLHTWGHPILDKNGNAIRLIGICQDITERKIAEEKLRAEERLRALIFQTVNDALFYLKAEPEGRFRFLYVNDAFLRNTGLSPSQVTGRYLEDVIRPPSLSTVLDNYMRAIRDHRAYHWEEESLFPTGTRYGEVSISPVFEHGKCVGLVGTVHDITDRKEAEKKMQRAHAILKAVIEGTTDSVFVKDLGGRYLMINPSGAEFLGKREEDIIGKTNRDIFPPDVTTTLDVTDREILATGAVQTREETLTHDGQTKTVSITKGPFRNTSGEIIGTFGISRDITELKRINAQIAQSLSLLRATLESTADGILMVDHGETILGFNQRFVELWNIPKDIIDSRDDSKALTFVLNQLKNPESFLAKVRELYASPDEESFDVLEFKDGKIFERYSRPQKLGNRIIGRVWSFRDISARVRTERALRESEARKSAMLDSALDAIITMDHEGKIVELNSAAEKTFGYSHSYARGKELAELIIPPDLRESHRAGFARYLATGQSQVLGKRIEFPAIREDGVQFPVEVSISRIPYPGPPVFTGFIRDITERKHAAERLNLYALRTQLLADVSKDLAEARLDLNAVLSTLVRKVAEFFEDGCIARLFIEDRSLLRTAAFHHVDAEALKHMADLLPRAHAMIDEISTKEILKTGQPALVSGSTEQLRYRINPEYSSFLDRFPVHCWMIVPLRVAGRIIGTITTFRFRLAPYYTKDELAFFQELADRAALAIDNAQLYNSAQKAVQLREDFLSIASHELRTPLTPLKLQLQLLSNFLRTGVIAVGSQAQTLQRLISESDQQIYRLSRLIEDMLDASRFGTGQLSLKREDADLVKIVAEAIGRCGSQLLSAKCPVELEAPSPVFGRWDKVRMEQVATNLISNALKYGSGHPIKVSVSAADGHAVLSVQDFGIGISKEDQAKIFERFGRVASVSRFGGLGMGLFITRQIVEAHGGEISVESQLEHGSKFTVVLPLREETA